MKILIVGCGRIGHTLAELLGREDHQVTVMDISDEAVSVVTDSCDVIGYVGNGTSIRDMREAGVAEADLVIAATDRDETNMLTCLIARKAGHCQTIARVRSPQYSEEINFLKEELGLSMSVNAEMAAASEMARLIQIPSAMEADTFAKGKATLISFVIPEKSLLDGLTLREMSGKISMDVLICVVERGGDAIIPDGNFRLQSGDKISITIPLSQINEFLNRIGIKAKRIRNVLIAGGGTMSYYLADRLIRMGVEVKILEKDYARCEELTELLPKAMIIHGDPTDRKLLTEESIEKMDAVCALMDSDEENILLAYYVGKLNTAKLMTKIHRNSYEDIISDMKLGKIISTKKITAEYISRYIRSMENSMGSEVETLYRMMDDRVEALEFVIKDSAHVIGIPLKDLPIIPQTLICLINRDGKIIRPGGRDSIKAGDTVIVVTARKGLNDINMIVRDNK